MTHAKCTFMIRFPLMGVCCYVALIWPCQYNYEVIKLYKIKANTSKSTSFCNWASLSEYACKLKTETSFVAILNKNNLFTNQAVVFGCYCKWWQQCMDLHRAINWRHILAEDLTLTSCLWCKISVPAFWRLEFFRRDSFADAKKSGCGVRTTDSMNKG